MAMRNFKLTIEYDGSSFHGWQRQPDAVSIQGCIENVLQRLTVQPIVVHGAGRTDAGVHALGQTAHFQCVTRLEPRQLQRGLNSLLPAAIRINACCEAPRHFHARYDAAGKIYQYRIVNRPVAPAIGRQYVWHLEKPLNLPAMRYSLTHLLGLHDFKAFEGAGSAPRHTVRHIFNASLVEEKPGHLSITFQGNGFLRHMVRNLVGTLVWVGQGKLTPDDVLRIRQSRNRHQAGATAPAQGLFLVEVLYYSTF